MTRQLIQLVFVALLMAMTTCILAGCEDDEKARDVIITRSANQKVVSAASESNITVVLPGNPTTGYDWEITGTDESLLKSAGSSFKPDNNMAGSGGERRFEFKAAGAGQVRLRLVYKRFWESAVAETFEVTIIIR
jgi:inhibitor of cysteine peptidase